MQLAAVGGMPTVALGAKFVKSRAGGQPATSTRGAWVVYPGYPWGLPDVGLGRLFAVRCAVQVHLSHNVLGVNFVRAVRVMRQVVFLTLPIISTIGRAMQHSPP